MTLEDVAERSPKDMPVAALLDAWRNKRDDMSVNDVIMDAGRRRQTGAGPEHKERALQTPTTKRHSLMLAYALLPTIERVRMLLFGRSESPMSDRGVSEQQTRDLDHHASQIAAASGFSADAVRNWIVTGVAPRLPILVTFSRHFAALPGGRWIEAPRIRIDLCAPLSGEAEIRAVAREVRRQWRIAGAKCWNEADIRLHRAVQASGRCPGGARAQGSLGKDCSGGPLQDLGRCPQTVGAYPREGQAVSHATRRR